MVPDFITLLANRTGSRGRRTWRLSSGDIGTVEEVAREYYMNERGFCGCLIDSACTYGGLLWILFHDILFHDNMQSHQPLCAQFYHTAERFYELHREQIESRLSEYQENREHVFDANLPRFLSHPFFNDPRSRIGRHHGSWTRRNASALRSFAIGAPEHNDIALIREVLRTSRRGVNTGWPDLVVWDRGKVMFAEVKSTDQLSDEQCDWIAAHAGSNEVEPIRVVEADSPETDDGHVRS